VARLDFIVVLHFDDEFFEDIAREEGANVVLAPLDHDAHWRGDVTYHPSPSFKCELSVQGVTSM
jgi:hypothetical protein